MGKLLHDLPGLLQGGRQGLLGVGDGVVDVDVRPQPGDGGGLGHLDPVLAVEPVALLGGQGGARVDLLVEVARMSRSTVPKLLYQKDFPSGSVKMLTIPGGGSPQICARNSDGVIAALLLVRCWLRPGSGASCRRLPGPFPRFFPEPQGPGFRAGFYSLGTAPSSSSSGSGTSSMSGTISNLWVPRMVPNAFW